MTKIKIYYGPKSGFTTYFKNEIDEDNSVALTTLVRKVDDLTKEHIVLVQGSEQEKPVKEKIKEKNLIIHSDEYASVNEHVILNFEGFITSIEVENIYLHNPPELLAQKLIKSFPDSKINYYEYKDLTLSLLKQINEDFHEHIIDQETVKNNLINALISQIYSDEKKPKIIMFYGPSGVGKTETAKFVAQILGGELFRKQLSMFQNNDFLSYVFGGHLYEKSFAKDLLERETNVILLDEFDKAAPVFHSAFYQLFDEGIFIDKNYNVNIGNPIVICTSNYDNEDEIRKKLGDPIFSRFNTFIKFNNLSNGGIRKVIKYPVEKEYKLLNEQARKIINVDKVVSLFEPYISKLKNVRRINNMVKNIIADEIRKTFFN